MPGRHRGLGSRVRDRVVPPSQFGDGSPVVYVLIVCAGVGIVGLLVPYLFYRKRSDTWKTAPAEEAI